MTGDGKKHIHLFATEAERASSYTRSNSIYVEPWISYTVETDKINYNLPHDYACDYLTFIALDNNVKFSFTNNTFTVNRLNYSIDNGTTWVAINDNIETPGISAGDSIMFKGDMSPRYNGSSDVYLFGTFNASGRFNACGNPLSLIYGDNFIGVVNISNLVCGPVGLFKNNTYLISANNLSLCATKLTENAYEDVFRGCTELTGAPELPALELKPGCYYNMFNGCSKLNYIKAMFTTTPSSTYTYNWVSGVSATGTFVKNSTATWNVTGTNGVPSGWTVETASA